MDNKSFEQQFAESIKAPTTSSPTPPMFPTKSPKAAPVNVPTPTTSQPKISLFVAIMFGFIALIEAIALVITLNNYFSLLDISSEENVTEEDEPVDEIYKYDTDLNLVAFDLVCVSKDSSYYVFDIDNEYEYFNGANSLAASGKYTITNDDLISVTGLDKVLYYDGTDIADGLNIYECEEVTLEESDADNTANE